MTVPVAKAPSLMILGTASGVGKSLLTAGLCRILSRSGVRVAPFKPQNMSNNAAACPSGGEIGRAQALQAFACGLEPHPDMNPILIKPEADQRAQLVVRGRPRGVLRASRFREDREGLLEVAVECFDRLREQYDWVWVEGAGSPAEPNLRAGDLANLGFATAVDIDAWLVGDIDRGGVFAALLGTLGILSPEDRARIRSLVINRFRGSVTLLDGMPEWLAERAGMPVLGLVPHVADLRLPEEDAPYRWREASSVGPRAASVRRIGVVVYPTASNLADIDPLSLEPGLEPVLLDDPEELSGFDLVILPGSKSVRSDLQWLRARGFVPVLERHVRYGGKVLGICGGMQMLGHELADPLGIEGGGETRGLGWLPVRTELAAAKRVREIGGDALWPERIPFAGYEIHHGRTTGDDARYPFHAVSADDRVWGTYVHGLFDAAGFRRAVLRAWWADVSIDGDDLRDRWVADLDRLADTLFSHLDLSSVETRLSVRLR